MVKKESFLVFPLLAKQKGIIQAVSTRALGDMAAPDKKEKEKNRRRFLNQLGYDFQDLVTMEQTHGNQIKVVSLSDRGKKIKGVDGLITTKENVVLGVRSADCVPLVAFDPQKKVLGVAHGGWKGIIKKIGLHLIKKMSYLGASPENLLVGIGPHIGVCCYTIDKERKKQFLKVFGPLLGMIREREDIFSLDLAKPLVSQLIGAGILEKNIELAGLCSACETQEFFSLRNKKRPFGEFLTVAALKEAS